MTIWRIKSKFEADGTIQYVYIFGKPSHQKKGFGIVSSRSGVQRVKQLYINITI